MEKQAFDFTIPIPAIVGAITGANIAKGKVQKSILEEQEKKDNTTVLAGNYYSQVGNIAQNLRVLFTPFSVIYVLKNGVKEITIDTIDTESMNRDMYISWQNKDEVYFKNILLNKMKSEIQFAEQQFAKNIIDRHLEINKKASYELTPLEVFDYANSMHGFYEDSRTEKIACVTLGDYEGEVKIATELGISGKSIGDKFSDIIGTPLAFLGIHNKDSLKVLQNNLSKPGFIKRYGKIGFMPDRVLFITENTVLSSLPVFDMDDDAFEAFQKRDEQYFLNLFNNEVKVGLKRIHTKLPAIEQKMNKEAQIAIIGISDIFYNSNVHPMIYYEALTKQYGDEWLSFEPQALVKILEKDFNLEEPIEDIPLNKMMSIQAVNKSVFPFTNPHTFEKMIRSFASLPINWMTTESDDIEPDDFAFALDVFDMVTPDDDTYDNFNDEIFSYIVKLLANRYVKVFMPTINMSKSENHMSFYRDLNKSLKNENYRLDIDGSEKVKEKADIIYKNDMICEGVINALDTIRRGSNQKDIKALLSEAGIDESVMNIATIQVRNNLDTDTFLNQQEAILNGQRYLYGITD